MSLSVGGMEKRGGTLRTGRRENTKSNSGQRFHHIPSSQEITVGWRKEKTHKKTMKHLIRIQLWMDLHWHGHHAQKKYSVTNGTDKQNNTKCWKVSGSPPWLAEKQLSGSLLPAGVTWFATTHSIFTQPKINSFERSQMHHKKTILPIYSFCDSVWSWRLVLSNNVLAAVLLFNFTQNLLRLIKQKLKNELQ